MGRRALSILAGVFLTIGCSAPASSFEIAEDEQRTTDAEREARAAARFESLRGSPALEGFLRAMPKGGDLHNHLSGAVYAESYIAWARQDGLCLDRTRVGLVPASQCGNPGVVALPDSPADPLYDEIVRAWSMKDFVPSPTESGHDHFFATFGKFGLASSGHTGDMLAEVRQRAADDNEQYLELMLGISASSASRLGDRVWGTGPGTVEPTEADLGEYYERLMASADLPGVIAGGSAALDTAEAKSRALLGCDSSAPQAGCAVTVRYLYQTSRTSAPRQLFAAFVGAFETAMRDSRVVGMNLVSPEDHPVALRDYELQMSMLDFLHRKYEGRSPLHITLHAGELTAAILPPNQLDALDFHIRSAVEKGHAERIGHGSSILSEEDSPALRRTLRERHIAVETCLASSDEILELSGKAHPLKTYLGDGVPIVLATDDPGVARSSMTLEYLRAANDQRLDYRQLKAAARQSIESSFVPAPERTKLRAELEARFKTFELGL